MKQSRQVEFRLTVASGTDPGQVRTVNQDSVLAVVRPGDSGNARGILIVADGMGGHQAGDVASRLAVETIADELSWLVSESGRPTDSTGGCPPGQEALEENADEWEPILESYLREAVEKANMVIHQYALDHPAQAGNLGCTVTCCLVCGNRAVVANVGDSRTYRLREHELMQVTSDHSFVWQLYQDGHLTEREIFEHPQRNIITRALGSLPGVAVDVQSCTLADGDRLLLCSDGLWEMIRDADELGRLARAEALEAAVKQLIDAANGYGGVDNIGVVVAQIEAV